MCVRYVSYVASIEPAYRLQFHTCSVSRPDAPLLLIFLIFLLPLLPFFLFPSPHYFPFSSNMFVFFIVIIDFVFFVADFVTSFYSSTISHSFFVLSASYSSSSSSSYHPYPSYSPLYSSYSSASSSSSSSNYLHYVPSPPPPFHRAGQREMKLSMHASVCIRYSIQTSF